MTQALSSVNVIRITYNSLAGDAYFAGFLAVDGRGGLGSEAKPSYHEIPGRGGGIVLRIARHILTII